MLVGKTVAEMLDAFASSEPTPGGGSASALAGAVGASLLLMVARMPRTRTAPDVDRPVLERAAATLAPLERELRSLIDRDAEAYAAVVAAYRLPKATDEDKAARHAAIGGAMKGAVETPLAMIRACRATLVEAERVALHGNPNAASDVTVAKELLAAALRGAQANVEINLPSIADAQYVARVREILNSAS
jgi:formiminotetrahydrofolate cyclodeaminase